MGRFAEICANAGADVHAIDLSVAVEAAFANLGSRDNVSVYQADIMAVRARQSVRDRFDSARLVQETEAMYRQTLFETRGGAPAVSPADSSSSSVQ